MTRPETCGAAGGALRIWFRVIECENSGSIVSTYSGRTTGSGILCFGSTLRYILLSNLELLITLG